MKSLERTIEILLYRSRWLLLPIYAGLAVLLVFMAIVFISDLVEMAPKILAISEKDAILAALSLIDLALISSLLVMVIISGYENFVSRLDLDQDDEKLAWVGKLDSGTLKLKVAYSIVAISSVHLLKAFMNADKIPDNKLLWLVVIHLTFVASAFAMAFIERYLSDRSDPASRIDAP